MSIGDEDEPPGTSIFKNPTNRVLRAFNSVIFSAAFAFFLSVAVISTGCEGYTLTGSTPQNSAFFGSELDPVEGARLSVVHYLPPGPDSGNVHGWTLPVDRLSNPAGSKDADKHSSDFVMTNAPIADDGPVPATNVPALGGHSRQSVKLDKPAGVADNLLAVTQLEVRKKQHAVLQKLEVAVVVPGPRPLSDNAVGSPAPRFTTRHSTAYKAGGADVNSPCHSFNWIAYSNVNLSDWPAFTQSNTHLLNFNVVLSLKSNRGRAAGYTSSSDAAPPAQASGQRRTVTSSSADFEDQPRSGPSSGFHYANRTLCICLRANDNVWRPVGHAFFPAVDSDSVLDVDFGTEDDRLGDRISGGPSNMATGSNGREEVAHPDLRQPNDLVMHDQSKNSNLIHHNDDYTEDLAPLFDDLPPESSMWMSDSSAINIRTRREGPEDLPAAAEANPRILAIRLLETSSKLSYTEDGRITILEDLEVPLEVIGMNINNNTAIVLTTSRQEYGAPCGYTTERYTKTVQFDVSNTEAGVSGTVYLPAGSLKYYSGENNYYVCVKNPFTGEFVHQGYSKSLQIEVYSLLLPVWLMGCLCVILLTLSGLFSGLNLGLMSLDQTELRIILNTGSETERSYAKAIMPIRGMGNFLLCSILLGNVLVNNTLTILLDTLTGGGGIVAVIGATIGIVIFGEIIPQALCSRHGLAVGAKTIYLTKFFMLLTSPLSYPLSIILDKILGIEMGTVYNRERLMELIKVTEQYTDFEKDEVNIVTGALVLKRKCVKDVMTYLEDCYMLPIDAVLDFETISEIKEKGYSRIPVYKGERANVVHILFARDLLFIDPDDSKPLEEVCKFYKNDVNFVYQDTILTDMFDEFKSGEKGHMALVQEVNTEGDGDPFYETVGLVTLEDIIEEIIQQEIVDETDVIIDNKTKKKRKRDRPSKDADLKMFLDRKPTQKVTVTPQISLAVYQFLTTSVKAFNNDVITPRVMQKLLTLDVYSEIKVRSKKNEVKDSNCADPNEILMTKGKVCDYFILIIEGRVEVTIGKEEHKFIEGPFTAFGEQMLEQIIHEPGVVGRKSGSAESGLPSAGSTRPAQWTPDYTLRAISDVLYLKIMRNTYTVALKASRMNSANSDISERDIDYLIERIAEEDKDDRRSSARISDHHSHSLGGGGIRSPDKSWGHGDGGLSPGTPEFRRESLRNSLNMLKTRLLGGSSIKSSGSIDKSKEDFWDGISNSTSGADQNQDEYQVANQTGARDNPALSSIGEGSKFFPMNTFTGGRTGSRGGDEPQQVQPLQHTDNGPKHGHNPGYISNHGFNNQQQNYREMHSMSEPSRLCDTINNNRANTTTTTATGGMNGTTPAPLPDIDSSAVVSSGGVVATATADIATNNQGEPVTTGGDQATTVIKVKGGVDSEPANTGKQEEGGPTNQHSPNDRTSLLHNENPVS